jgi:hypothetical protein
VELLGATRAETSGLARCHGAADELQNRRRCVQKTGCLKVILERTMARVSETGARCGIVYVAQAAAPVSSTALVRVQYTPRIDHGQHTLTHLGA